MPQDNLELLRLLETQQATARRRAVWGSWVSVLAAAVVLAVLIVAAYRHLAAVQKRVAAAKIRIGQLQRKEAELNDRVKQLQPLVENYQAEVRAQQRPATREEIPASSPGLEGSEQLPRVYLQIVDPGDRDYAKEVGKRLEEAGFVVPGGEYGGEYVPEAAALKNTEVRFYKKADEADAVRLRKALESAGVKSPALLYLGLENNKKVRPKHYEVWFGAGVGGPRAP